jgi:hypothetical protein
LHVPSIDLVGGGDVFYNQCHMYVGDTTPESRSAPFAGEPSAGNRFIDPSHTGHVITDRRAMQFCLFETANLRSAEENTGWKPMLHYNLWENRGGFGQLMSGRQPTPLQAADLLSRQLLQNLCTRCRDDRTNQKRE